MKAVLGSGIPSIVLQPSIYLENLQTDMIAPRLKCDGILDYPPLGESQKVMWTSHWDQARVAVAAMARPDLAGNAYEVAKPGALTGGELAALLSDWLGRPVRYEPLTPTALNQRFGDVLCNPGVSFALTDLYGAMAKMGNDDMIVDTAPLEATFDVTLTPVADHIAGWGK